MRSLYALRHFVTSRRPVNPVRRAAIETLETRRLLDAVAPNFLVIADGTQNFGNTRRSLNYYDVSNLTPPSPNYFAQTPTFTLWPGYEITSGRNFEDFGAFDVNPFNGDTYFLAFDAGPVGTPDPVGDTQGDYDLYRFNFTNGYSDFIVNARPKGIMYTDTVTPDNFNYQTNYGTRPLGPTGLPDVTNSDAGVPDGRNNADSDPKNDFMWIDGLVDKIGEVRRYGAAGSTPFFDPQDIQFVDPGKILLMENKPTAVDGGTLDNDYSIRTLERISLTPGAATPQANDTGGYNGNTSESWESFLWSGNNFVDMDNFAVNGTNSEVDGMRYVERDGLKGVWVSDRDGGGDEVQFFELNFTTRVATKQGILALDEDPALNDNQGDIDFFEVDEAGSLFIGESGVNDTPPTEPNMQSLTITTYTGGVTFGTWTVEPDIAPTLDDDPGVVTDGRFGVLNRGQDRIYYFDADTAGPDAPSDVYVYDLNTNTLIYQELNAANHFTIKNHLRAFSLGDYAITGGNLTSQDGIVKAADIDALYARVADPTLGGRFSTALGSEMFDLTGEHTMTGGTPTGSGVNGDVDYLVRRSLQTEYGDANLDARVNLLDYNIVSANFNQSPRTWAQGDFTGNGLVNLADYNALSSHFNFVAAASSVPRFAFDDDKDEKEDDAVGLKD